jgi:hypothetical protein
MTLYYDAAMDKTADLADLKESYDSAAKMAVADCGTAYATLTTGISGSGLSLEPLLGRTMALVATTLVVSALVLL